MRNIHRSFIWACVVAALAFSTVALATPQAARGPQARPERAPGGPPHGPGMGRPRMSLKDMNARSAKTVHNELKPALKLTAAQEKKILAVYQKSNKAVYATLSDKKLKREDAFKKFRALRDKSNAAVKAILTPKQKKLYDAWLLKRRSRFMGGPGGPGGPRRPGGPSSTRAK